MFVRRYYYDLSTGKTVTSYMRQGAVLQGSVAEDFDVYPELKGKTLDEVGVMEWFVPDAEIETNFSTFDGVKLVDGELVFFNYPVPEKPTYEELETAYTILTGGADDE